jgi:hypothetical protein
MLSNRWCVSPTAKREACRRPDKERCVGRSCRVYYFEFCRFLGYSCAPGGPCRYRRRIPCKKRRELIKKVREADPLQCPEVLMGNAHRFAHRREGCYRAHPAPSRAPARGVRVHSATDPPGTPFSIRGSTTFPRLRHRTGHGVLRHLKRPAVPECASRTLVQRSKARV